jgi:hypothetical protein
MKKNQKWPGASQTFPVVSFPPGTKTRSARLLGSAKKPGMQRMSDYLEPAGFGFCSSHQFPRRLCVVVPFAAVSHLSSMAAQRTCGCRTVLERSSEERVIFCHVFRLRQFSLFAAHCSAPDGAGVFTIHATVPIPHAWAAVPGRVWPLSIRPAPATARGAHVPAPSAVQPIRYARGGPQRRLFVCHCCAVPRPQLLDHLLLELDPID